MKLLLTSTGFKNKKISIEFLKLVEKSPSKIKILFIPTASRTKEEWEHVNTSKEELINLGIPEKNITLFDLEREISYKEIQEYDVMYVCGGNTFYLLKKIKEIKFDKLITTFVKDNKIFVGVSAGSIIACPDIDIASPFDENDVGLKDIQALHFIEDYVSPHYCKEEEPLITTFKKTSKYKIILLTDEEALLIKGKESKIIK